MNRIGKSLVMGTVISSVSSGNSLDEVNKELAYLNEYFSRETRKVLTEGSLPIVGNNHYSYIRTQYTPEGESPFIEPGMKVYGLPFPVGELKLYKNIYTEDGSIKTKPFTIENKYKFNDGKSEFRVNASIEPEKKINSVEVRHHPGPLFYIQGKYNTDTNPKKNKWYIGIHLFLKKFMW